ncbi:MAG: helix-turn-helix domain-containing protein [Bacillota bacterium]|nr:helix-turn-helix domain-containing protein [Bacillota bacterium]HPZ55052.1 helix-turn-helix domain-containing protein [Bacillota bacterium]
MDKVRVPVDLLLDSALTASTKVLWMALRLYPEIAKGGRPSRTRLAALTGLSRPTIRKGLARLTEAGWYGLPSGHQRSSGGAQEVEQGRWRRKQTSTPQLRGSHRTQRRAHGRFKTHVRHHSTSAQQWTRRYVTIPRELIEDRFIKPQAVVIYGVLQALPEFRFPNGKYTCKQLRELTDRAPKTIRRAINVLVQHGWLGRTRQNHLCPFIFTVRNPVHEECMAELARVEKRLSRAKFKGEGLMKEYLSLIVDSDEFQDNATPGFLVNPFTDERMELDRYYPGRVAFEFNGPQHYKPTEFSSPREVEKQQLRDKIKEWICEKRGIRLVVVHAEDLTLQTMIEKVGTCLPLRDLRKRRLVIRYLERISSRYRRAALQPQAHTAETAPNMETHA